jgi:FtsP/CotA-like multicopper oxidase with cupredoxin domain
MKQDPVVFQVSSRGGTNARTAGFKIDNARYDMDCFNHEVELNTSEEWTLQNKPFGGGSVPHPFHIHVNPFQLKGDKINPDGPDDWTNYRWWDTIAIIPNQNRVIRHRFTDYPGEFVIHCHILVHEDLGMMQNIVVKDDGTGTGSCCPVPGGSCPNPPSFTRDTRCSNFS